MMITNMKILLALTVTIFYVETIIAKSSRPTIKLTHPLSIHSPLYDPNTTNTTDIIVDASEARFKFLEANARNAYRLPVHPMKTGLGFLVEASIGTPGVPQFLSLDTGSSFTWTQCIPCRPCKKHRGVDYNHLLSQSVLRIPCGSPECRSAPQNVCIDQSCKYTVGYVDGSSSSGIVMSETFTFTDGSKVSGLVFGCGFVNEGGTQQDSAGILGLGHKEISIVHHIGSKFSYCLGYMHEPEHHFLMIGDGAKMLGNPSPLTMRNHYYVSLVGIMVGDVQLNIDPALFRLQPDGTGGVVIDSGASLSYLLQPAYEALTAEIARRMNGFERATNEDVPDMICYKGFLKNLRNFPLITLNFEGGQNLQLIQYSAFYQRNAQMFCLTFMMSPRGWINLIGYSAQQGYNVGFDILGQTIHFHRAPCQYLANQSY